MPMGHDKIIRNRCGVLLASYGPRKADIDGNVVEAPHDPEFWGVYRHNAVGEARHILDAPTQLDAQRAADQIAKGQRLTVAYIAMGVHYFLDGAPIHIMAAMQERFGGEVDFVDDITEYAGMLDVLVDTPDGRRGCFAYEVAQPFGYKLAWAVLHGMYVDPKELARSLLAPLL